MEIGTDRTPRASASARSATAKEEEFLTRDGIQLISYLLISPSPPSLSTVVSSLGYHARSYSSKSPFQIWLETTIEIRGRQYMYVCLQTRKLSIIIRPG